MRVGVLGDLLCIWSFVAETCSCTLKQIRMLSPTCPLSSQRDFLKVLHDLRSTVTRHNFHMQRKAVANGREIEKGTTMTCT